MVRVEGFSPRHLNRLDPTMRHLTSAPFRRIACVLGTAAPAFFATACTETPTGPSTPTVTTVTITDTYEYRLDLDVNGFRGQQTFFDEEYDSDTSSDPLANTIIGQSPLGARGTAWAAVEPGEITVGVDMTSGGEPDVTVYADPYAEFARTSCGYTPGTVVTATLSIAPAQAATPTGDYAANDGEAFLGLEFDMDLRGAVGSRWVDGGAVEAYLDDRTGYQVDWEPRSPTGGDSDGINPFDGYTGFDLTVTSPEISVDPAGCVELEVALEIDAGIDTNDPGSVSMVGAYSLSVFIES